LGARGAGAAGYDASVKVWPVVVAVVACGDNRTASIVIMDVGSNAPAYGRAPFPTDAIREGDHLGVLTGLDAIVPAHSDLVAAHLAALDGFGLRPTVEFFIDGPLDPVTIPAHTAALGDPLVVLDLGRDEVVAMDWIYDVDRGVVAGAVSPGAALFEATRYAAVITSDVHSASGEPLLRAHGLDEQASDRWQSTADVSLLLDAKPALAHRIAGLAVFTTEHASDVLVAAREVLASGAVPAPTLGFGDPAIIFDTPARLDALLGHAQRDTSGPRAGLEKWGTDNPTGMAHDHVGVVATGQMTIARFRGDDTGSDGPEDETFQLDGSGTPMVQSIDAIPVTFVLPKSQPPAAGFPVVIFGHGLGGSRHAMLNLAEPLTAAGYAVVAIDMWGHGSRFAGDMDLANNLGTKPGFTGDPSLRDGFGDDPGYAAYIDFFEGFLNVAAIRDSIRQSALDFSRLATLLQQPLDLSAMSAPFGAAPKLDPAHVAYLGESFGTIVGTDLAALEPSIDLFVLDVPGGGLLDQILPGSATIGTLAVPLIEQIYRASGRADRFHPLLSMMQAVFDGADPLTFAPHVLSSRFSIAGRNLSPRNVVCIEVIGDEIMANTGTNALAYAFNLDVLTPDLDPPAALVELPSPIAGNRNGQTAVLVQYAPATHGYNWSAEHGNLDYQPGFPHDGDDPFPKLPKSITIAEPIYETLAQVIEILDTHRAGQPPRVRSTKAPVHDFDGDGVLDDQDPCPWDPGC
jgi:dienelactone hydrolase